MNASKPQDAGIDAEVYRRARARMLARKGFFIHATVYVAVNLMLFLIDLVTPGPVWFFWPLIGWGIGLAAHGVVTFQPFSLFGGAWEDRTMARLIEDERRKSHKNDDH